MNLMATGFSLAGHSSSSERASESPVAEIDQKLFFGIPGRGSEKKKDERDEESKWLPISLSIIFTDICIYTHTLCVYMIYIIYLYTYYVSIYILYIHIYTFTIL